jgi:hypothetical protein
VNRWPQPQARMNQRRPLNVWAFLLWFLAAILAGFTAVWIVGSTVIWLLNLSVR